MTDEDAVKEAIVRIDSYPVTQAAREALEAGAILHEVRERYDLTNVQLRDLELIHEAYRKRD